MGDYERVSNLVVTRMGDYKRVSNLVVTLFNETSMSDYESKH